MSEALVHVVAAVIRQGDRFLLARRPPGKVYAGWWEFPGGKVEAGESDFAALVRELHEEMGITITAATPWLLRTFAYPHATVRIRFFRVTAWDGELRPLEHDAIAWLPLGAAPEDCPEAAPILPANGPILAALALPEVCALTHAEANGVEAELLRIDRALANGLRLIQVRDKALPAAARATFAAEVVRRAHAAGARVLINDDATLAAACGADGVHLSAAALAACSVRPEFALVGASCHDAGELDRAAALGCDFALLGAVCPTATHPGAPGLGWPIFETLAAEALLPVYALGSMSPADLPAACAHGAHGIALMRGW